MFQVKPGSHPPGNAFQGKLIVPFGVVFTNITRKQFAQSDAFDVFPRRPLRGNASNALSPNRRVSARMEDREYNQLSAADAIEDAEWKTPNFYSPDASFDDRRAIGKFASGHEGQSNFHRKLGTKPRTSALVPADRSHLVKPRCIPKYDGDHFLPRESGSDASTSSRVRTSSGVASSSARRVRSSAR